MPRRRKPDRPKRDFAARVAIEDEAEEVQAADECQRDRAEQEARRPRPDPEADSDRCDSDDQRAHLADPNQHRAGADEPRP